MSKNETVICKSVLKSKSQKDVAQNMTKLYVALINEKENRKLKSVV